MRSVNPLCKSRDFFRFIERDGYLFAKIECTKVKIAQFKNCPKCIVQISNSTAQVQTKLEVQTEKFKLAVKMPKGYPSCQRKEDLEKISKKIQSTKAVKRRDKNAEKNCYASKTHFLFIISQKKWPFQKKKYKA